MGAFSASFILKRLKILLKASNGFPSNSVNSSPHITVTLRCFVFIIKKGLKPRNEYRAIPFICKELSRKNKLFCETNLGNASIGRQAPFISRTIILPSKGLVKSIQNYPNTDFYP